MDFCVLWFIAHLFVLWKLQLDVKAAKKAILDGMDTSCTSPDFNSFSLPRAIFLICHSTMFSFSSTFLSHHCFSNLGFRRTDESLLQESLAGTIRNTLFPVRPLNAFLSYFFQQHATVKLEKRISFMLVLFNFRNLYCSG